MIETLAAGAGGETGVDDDLGSAGLLSALRTARRTEDAAAARQLHLAAGWADLHPPESVLLDQVKGWCRDSRTRVTIRPVIDLTAELSAPGYPVPDRIREHVNLRDRTCVFPWCSRPARSCDIDHVVPYDPHATAEGRPQPGPTTTPNLAALCRHHHRLKTHTAWRYQVTGPGEFEWTSPHGHRFRRDPSGSTAIDPPRPPRRR